MRGRPFVVISLRALYSMDSLVTTMFICMLVCANIILCRYLLGPLALLDLMISLQPFGRTDRQVFQLRLVGEFSAHHFIH